MFEVIMMQNGLIPFEKKKAKKFDLKNKEKQIACSLFEVEKFLCCVSNARKCGCFAKFIGRNIKKH